MIDISRLRRPQPISCYWSEQLVFRQESDFQTYGEPFVITDPTYLADVFNSDDVIACYVREQGVILNEFGGDVSCPIWWQPPFLMMPLADRVPMPALPPDVTVLTQEVGCDAGAFVFLPVVQEMPIELHRQITGVIASKNGVLLTLPAGVWSVWYEGEPDEDGRPGKIVARCEPRPFTSVVQLQLSF